MMNLKKTAFNLCVVGLFATSAPSFADDGKTFPGAMCQPKNATDAAVLVASSSSLHNNSTSRRTSVVCGLVRDNFNNTSGTKDVKVNVYRDTRYAQTAFTCTLYSRAEDGSYKASKTGSFSGSGKGYIGLDVNSGAKHGNYSVICSVPRYSLIYSILLLEH